MRTQEERDQQTLAIMSAVFGAAVLAFLFIAVIGVLAYIW
jgi:hypothetical protein